jgi:uncharacterized protein YdiU (UPF0061 family)
MPPIAFDNSYARLPEHFYADVLPSRVPNAQLIRLNTKLADALGLDATWLTSPGGLAMLAGNDLPEGTEPLAQAYAGHQFGGWVPQLGDGRAILLGEIIAPDGIRRDIQLKGSGRTPFSRGGDGKAAIGPVLREYILSEAMESLGVPTTRALAAVSTGETVHRETPLPGAILTRVAKSHLRVGTFQYFYARNDTRALRELADHAIARHYPEALHANNSYQAFLENVIAAQAKLIAQWMHLGFIHGVMNTDNMTISGETIDYGPCALMDIFHAEKVFSSIDRNGRYSWSNQPIAGHWNLMRLAEALSHLLSDETEKAKAIAEEAIATFAGHFGEHYNRGLAAKLGFMSGAADDDAFSKETLSTLAEQKVDFTLFFRHLTKVAAGGTVNTLSDLFASPEAFAAWFSRWSERTDGSGDDPAQRVKMMQAANPILIPRNHRVEEAIQDAEEGDFNAFNRLVDATAQPFADRPEFADLEQAPTPGQVVCQTFCGT